MIKPSVRANARRIAFGLGVTLLIAYAGLVSRTAFTSGPVIGVFVVSSALTIALFAATMPGAWRRARTAALSAMAWFLVLILFGGLVTLLKAGRLDEGGPVGLALVIGFYLGLPTAVLAVTAAPLLGRLLDAES